MIDFEKLKTVLPFLQDLNTEDMLAFLKYLQMKNLAQGEVFLEQGSRKNYIYFVKKGLIRSYHINEKGEEITNRLRYENQVISSYEIDVLQQPSKFYLQALEPTELFYIDINQMREIVDSNPKYEAGRRYFLNTNLVEALQTLDDFILLSPEKRYLKFMKQHPDLLNRVPMKYIANVLGITPVSLSRIRKRIASKKS